MKNYTKIVSGIMITILMILGSDHLQAQKLEKDVTVIELTQTLGEFVTKELNLKPGKYQFRVVNDNVEKELGFVIQKSKDKGGDVMKTAIPNSFTTAYIKKGDAQYTGVVELSAGEYVYSCPLNPTPHYKILVK
jgi:hypothetical protein